mmetsp:Transcript_90774/g.111113  ORF Transcript_90774/g.111113 Transcript_90774/m.111113 type:complete len:312 (+) Transcript_90774:68-1003(+)
MLDYQSGPKAEFQQQLKAFDAANKALQREIATMERNLKEMAEDPEFPAWQEKLQYLQGVISNHKTLRWALRLKDVEIEEKYDDLEHFPVVDGPDELEKLKAIYTKMTQLLVVCENTAYKLLGAPSWWYTWKVAEWSNWVSANPKTAASLVVGTTAFTAGVFYFLSWAGCACHPFLAVAQHALFGAVVGAAIGGGIVVFLALFYQGYRYMVPFEAESSTQKVAKMVEALKQIPDAEYLNQLDEMIAKCTSVQAQFPAREDRKCVVCLNEGEEVVEPVKAPRCKGHHYMCMKCWKDYITKPCGREGNCCVCNV